MSLIQACYPSAELASVDIHRNVTGQQGGVGGQPVEDNTKVLTGLSARVDKISGGQAERMFGRQSSSRWVAEFSDNAGIVKNDLVKLNSGPYSGIVIEVISIMIPLGELLLAECNDTQRVLA